MPMSLSKGVNVCVEWILRSDIVRSGISAFFFFFFLRDLTEWSYSSVGECWLPILSNRWADVIFASVTGECDLSPSGNLRWILEWEWAPSCVLKVTVTHISMNSELSVRALLFSFGLLDFSRIHREEFIQALRKLALWPRLTCGKHFFPSHVCANLSSLW